MTGTRAPFASLRRRLFDRDYSPATDDDGCFARAAKMPASGGVSRSPRPEVYSSAADELGIDGMTTVWDGQGRYLGCMGIETWERLLHGEVRKRCANEGGLPMSRFEIRRSVDLWTLLAEAAAMLNQARAVSGAPTEYRRVENDLRAVIGELDARAREAD